MPTIYRSASSWWARYALPTLRTEHNFAFSRRGSRPSFAQFPFPRKKRGSRECRVLAAPAVSCRRSAHEHTGTDGAIRHSLRNGFTAYAVLSPATNSSCHRRQRISGRSSSVELISPPHNLAPATGVGTTRFCRTQQHRSSCALSFTHGKPPCEHRLRATLPRPPQPVPTFVTMANAPLSGTGWRQL